MRRNDKILPVNLQLMFAHCVCSVAVTTHIFIRIDIFLTHSVKKNVPVGCTITRYIRGTYEKIITKLNLTKRNRKYI